ncbi:cyclic nucleotide-binding domain-containing protein [candidate division KSB1 bacterium]|nr:cyclic nucleotide-binding domain-containing protein [candidate division KSB1 bacterium]
MFNNHQNGNLRPTVVKRFEQYKDRWTSYGANAGILGISEKLSLGDLRRFEIFCDYSDEFLEEISADVAVTKWKKHAILFEEGTYLDLAFVVVSGSVEVYLRKAAPADLRRARPNGNAHAVNTVLQTQLSKLDKNGKDIVFLSAMDFNLPAGKVALLGAGEIFGEIGAMNGWPQSVTARAATDCVLLQIRVPALRRMKRKSSALKQRLDKIYRERSLSAQLRTTPLLQACDRAFLEALAQKVELVSYEPNEIIAKEGDPAEAFYLVRSGFVKLSQKMGEGEIVVSYLAKGMTLGEAELLLEGRREWHCTAASVEFTDLVKVSWEDFQALLKQHPGVGKRLWETAVARIKEMGARKKNLSQSQFVQTALEKGLVQGNSILVIDMDVCTRCDECVRGCADTHGGRPRFVREGDKYENFLITKACYHCHDPVCLVGCPTGAIRRSGAGDVVEIVDNLCIGCKACANNCPYDAIVMHETGEVWAQNMLPELLRGKPRLLASKCDLCYKTNHGPACVQNCPHGCAVRIGSVEEFQRLMAR